MNYAKLCVTMLLLCFSTTFLLAEKGDTVPGYIKQLDGLEVKGKIIIGSLTDNEVRVKFLTSGTKKPAIYKPTDLLGYGYEESKIDENTKKKIKIWKHYEQLETDYPPKPFGPTLVFVHRETDGLNKVFCYYIEHRAKVKEKLEYVYYLKTLDGNMMKMEKANFAKDAKKLFSAYPAMASQIGKNHFQYLNFSRMVRDYNYWIDNQHDENVYKMAPEQFTNG